MLHTRNQGFREVEALLRVTQQVSSQAGFEPWLSDSIVCDATLDGYPTGALLQKPLSLPSAHTGPCTIVKKLGEQRLRQFPASRTSQCTTFRL